MKKIFCTLIVFLMILVSYSDSYASLGVTVVKGIGTKILPAVQDKAQTWNNSFLAQKLSDEQFNDAMGVFADIRAQQFLLAKESALEEVSADFDGSLTEKAAEASQWSVLNDQQENFEGFMGDVSSHGMMKKGNSLAASEGVLARNIDNILDEDYETSNGIKSPLTNTATLYYPKTYKEDKKRAKKNKHSPIEDGLQEAINFVQLVVNPYNKEDQSELSLLGDAGSSLSKTLFLSKVAKRSLAFDVMNAPVVMRTNVKGGGLGKFMQSYMEKLDKEAGGKWLKPLRKELGNDISKYEFMDLMFSKITISPSWYMSLERSDRKALRRKKVELMAFLNMLNWETSNMINKMAMLSAADLAGNVDKLK